MEEAGVGPRDWSRSVCAGDQEEPGDSSDILNSWGRLCGGWDPTRSPLKAKLRGKCYEGVAWGGERLRSGAEVSAVERALQDRPCLGANGGRGVSPTQCERVLGRAVPTCAVV